MPTGFRDKVNSLFNIQNILESLNANIQTFKKLESNELGISKVVELETGIVTIRDNISKLILVANANNQLLGIANNLDDLLRVNTNTDNFFFEYNQAKVLVDKFRVEIDKILTLSPEIKAIFETINLKHTDINKNILIAQQSSQSASSSAGVAISAKNAIEEKYQVYLDATQIEDEVVIVAGVKNEIVEIKNNIIKIAGVFDKLSEISSILSMKTPIENLAANIQEIKDAIAITTDAKNVTNQNVTTTTQDKNLAKQYKDETLNNRNITLNLKDATVKAVSDMTSIVNQINRQTASNNKLAFSIHSISTKLSIEFSQVITNIKKIQEEKEQELNLFAKNLTQNLTLEIANAKTIVSKDVVTSQKIVSEITRDLSLLLDAKHRENKNELRFNDSELISLISVAKNMFNNKIIHEDATDIKNDVNTNIMLAKEDITDFKDVTLEDIEVSKKDALNLISADIKTSQKIVSQISESLSLLTDAKHRENLNQIRFKNSELVSLLAVSKMMIENKIISDDAKNQILQFEIKLKENDHEKIKNLLNSFTVDKRIELLVAKSLLTDIKLQTL